MLDWLLTPIDATRPHHVEGLVAWHARLMVLAWAVLLPAGVFTARFLKITPRQDWPRVLDNKTWWRLHLALQYTGALAVLSALALIVCGGPHPRGTHALLGWTVVVLTAAQVASGLLRGSKGGPTAPRADGALDGDHYLMTRRRRLFEYVHKSAGYIALLLSIAAILSGLWLANAPKGMWSVIALWWLLMLCAGVVMQRKGHAVDTYQAIWGPDPSLPGNQVPPIGWGIRRRTGTRGAE